MSTTITILGCGSSAGVPRIGGDWGACDPQNPKNRRRRCSIMVTKRGPGGETRVLVDTSPDMREQMLSADVKHLDSVLYTHEHADHIHGIDELRTFFLLQRRRIPVWAADRCGTMLLGCFGYCFHKPANSDYPPILSLHRIVPGEMVELEGAGGVITARPFDLIHGSITALGFRFGNAAYCPDVNAIPDEALPALEGLDLWIIDALRRTPHSSHFSLPETLAWIARLKPKRAVITNMHIDLDYDTLRRELPEGVEPAYDGMELEV